jgi:hypothetical protein
MDSASSDDLTPEKHRGGAANLREPWKPGQSGNPAGRPKGARSKLGESFIDALLEDFREHGVQSIRAMRAEKAADYVKVIASILPKEIDLSGEIETVAKDQRDAAVAAALRADR